MKCQKTVKNAYNFPEPKRMFLDFSFSPTKTINLQHIYLKIIKKMEKSSTFSHRSNWNQKMFSIFMKKNC